MSENIGSIMTDSRDKGLRSVAVFFGILTYCGMVVYSGIHAWQLMSRGVAPDMLIWALVGVIGLEITAIFLPVALHFWTFSPAQRFAAFAFYALDLLLVFLNVILSFAITADLGRPGWFDSYLLFIVPATPIIAGVGWSVLFMLDPSQRERGMVETLRASTKEALAVRIAEAARDETVNQLVAESARNLARDIVQDTLGIKANGVTVESIPESVPVEVQSKNGRVGVK